MATLFCSWNQKLESKFEYHPRFHSGSERVKVIFVCGDLDCYTAVKILPEFDTVISVRTGARLCSYRRILVRVTFVGVSSERF